MTEFLPTKATFACGEPIELEVRGALGPMRLALRHLDELVAELELPSGATLARFPAQPEGGYGVDADGASTALDVLADPLERLRYGFVSQFEPGREVNGVVDNVRRLHLNAVQFYDWMYRHARLLPPAETFADPLGRMLSLETVRRLAAALEAAGSLPLGYAAVYAAGAEEWPAWRDDGLFRPDGTPWTLGDDFLWIVDPTSERWEAHFAAQLHEAQAAVGFAGFQLDQYGAPKRALRANGTSVELAPAFSALIDRLSRELPEARLIFNNVNDFPTWSTAAAAQAATYIEVWPPHTTFRDLARLIAKAQLLAPRRPVVLAAYLSAYEENDAAGASNAEQLLLATVFSRGATAILHGEAAAVLTKAYFVDHAHLAAANAAVVRRYYDFAVRYGDLLFDHDAVDVTCTHLGGINQELTIDAPVRVSLDGEPRTLWAHAVQLDRGYVVNLINLSAQTDDRWAAAKPPHVTIDGVRVSVERLSRAPTDFLFADPDRLTALQRLETARDARYDSAVLPGFKTWGLLWVRPGVP